MSATLVDATSELTAPVVRVHRGAELAAVLPHLEDYYHRAGPGELSFSPAWSMVLGRGLRQVPFCLEATRGGQTCGLLPLSFIRSVLFGRFLVSLPYLNYGGVTAADEPTRRGLIDRAVALADELDVRHLELRGVEAAEHPALSTTTATKVHMRLRLPDTAAELWDQIPSKVRNQVRKGQKNGLTVGWGGVERLPDFYAIFSHNMRDLGTPVYGASLFQRILQQFPDRAEFCVVRLNSRPIASALLLHGRGVSEVPSASSLRRYNSTNANMLMYWHLLERAVARGQGLFDFGRSSPGSNTCRFKEQWGAAPRPAAWQYYLRRGKVADMRPENPRYQRLIRLWQRLPVPLSQLIGPAIVRGIP